MPNNTGVYCFKCGVELTRGEVDTINETSSLANRTGLVALAFLCSKCEAGHSHNFDYCSKIRATFAPTKVHDLVPGLHQWTGWRGLWSFVGDADPEGEYAGQPGFSIAVEEQCKGLIFPAAWIPFCDLSDVEVVS